MAIQTKKVSVLFVNETRLLLTFLHGNVFWFSVSVNNLADAQADRAFTKAAVLSKKFKALWKT